MPDEGARQNAGSVSETLDFAYDDFCMSEAVVLKEDAQKYCQRAMNYRNIYAPSVGLLRAKEENGSWRTPLDQ